MNEKLYFIACSFLAFIFCASSQAHLSINQEMTELSNKDEDVYIKNLIEDFYPGLNSFYQKHGIAESSEKKIAWLLTTRSIIKAIQMGAHASLMRVPSVKVWRKGDELNAILALRPMALVDKIALDQLKEIACEAEITVSLNAALEKILFTGAFREAVELANETYVPSIALALNMMERILANKVLQNLSQVLQAVFERSLAFVIEQRKSAEILSAGKSTGELDVSFFQTWYKTYKN